MFKNKAQIILIIKNNEKITKKFRSKKFEDGEERSDSSIHSMSSNDPKEDGDSGNDSERKQVNIF